MVRKFCILWIMQSSWSRNLTWYHCRFPRHFVLQIVPLPPANIIKNVIFQVFLLIVREFISRLSKTTFHILRGAELAFSTFYGSSFYGTFQFIPNYFALPSCIQPQERHKLRHFIGNVSRGEQTANQPLWWVIKIPSSYRVATTHTINCKRHQLP